MAAVESALISVKWRPARGPGRKILAFLRSVKRHFTQRSPVSLPLSPPLPSPSLRNFFKRGSPLLPAFFHKHAEILLSSEKKGFSLPLEKKKRRKLFKRERTRRCSLLTRTPDVLSLNRVSPLFPQNFIKDTIPSGVMTGFWRTLWGRTLGQTS